MKIIRAAQIQSSPPLQVLGGLVLILSSFPSSSTAKENPDMYLVRPIDGHQVYENNGSLW